MFLNFSRDHELFVTLLMRVLKSMILFFWNSLKEDMAGVGLDARSSYVRVVWMSIGRGEDESKMSDELKILDGEMSDIIFLHNIPFLLRK